MNRKSSSVRIALHGPSGSGKSQIREYLHQQHGFAVASSGAICREICLKLYGREDRKLLNLISAAMRTVDENVWIQAALRLVDQNRIVFDSIRYLSDTKVLRDAGFSLWTVICPQNVAENRLRQRGQVFSLADLWHESETSLREFQFDTYINNGERPWSAVCEDIDTEVKKLL